MFACLYSLTSPVSALVAVAEVFTPRFEVVGPVVVLDVSGVSRLFGTPREMAEQMRRTARGPIRIAIAPTQTTAVLLALSRPGIVVIDPDQQRATLARVSVSVLGEFEKLRHQASGIRPQASGLRLQAAGPSHKASSLGSQTSDFGPQASGSRHEAARMSQALPHVGEMFDALPYFQHSLRRTTDAAAAPYLAAPGALRAPAPGASSAPDRLAPSASASAHTSSGELRRDFAEAASGRVGAPSAPSSQPPRSGGWSHPRDAHAAAASTRRPRRAVSSGGETPALSGAVARAVRRTRSQEMAVEALLDILRRWGIRTLGELAALLPGDVYERLGARGVLWQRLARGDDSTPLVPWVPEDPFEAALDLEWPIEGLEPLSFVLGRLFEPLAERLERADRGAAILHTHLRLVDKTVHARMVQLPAPMRDPKTLRTLVLLDLESNPPGAAIDRVRVLIEPTPARVTQWALFERAQPSPEQVSTLLARLTALMGDSHVGSPRLVDSWKPGAFDMIPFTTPGAPSASAAARTSSGELRRDLAEAASGRVGGSSAPGAPGHTALRRFRLPIPARVHVQDGRPTRLTTDRRAVTGGVVTQCAGPWRTSGEWWNDGPGNRSWDRDEWDVAMSDGTIYRLYVERDVGQWFLDGVVD